MRGFTFGVILLAGLWGGIPAAAGPPAPPRTDPLVQALHTLARQAQAEPLAPGLTLRRRALEGPRDTMAVLYRADRPIEVQWTREELVVGQCPAHRTLVRLWGFFAALDPPASAPSRRLEAQRIEHCLQSDEPPRALPLSLADRATRELAEAILRRFAR